jgi:hypothetical protein
MELILHRDRKRQKALGPLAMELILHRDRKRQKALGPLAASLRDILARCLAAAPLSISRRSLRSRLAPLTRIVPAEKPPPGLALSVRQEVGNRTSVLHH